MKELTTRFINAKKEFLQTKGNENSVEKLYDIIYSLKENNDRNFEENYILAVTYNLVGDNISASKIIDNSLTSANGKEIERLKSIQNRIYNQQDSWNVKIYRDLRDSKIIKKASILSKDNFIIERYKEKSYVIKISKEIRSLVVLNKNMLITEDCRIFADHEPNDITIELLIEYITFLGNLNKDLLDFYNNTNIDCKINNAGQNWFDGLRVDDFTIEIKEDLTIETEIFIYDYLQNDFGFRLEIVNQEIKNIEYDPIL